MYIKATNMINKITELILREHCTGSNPETARVVQAILSCPEMYEAAKTVWGTSARGEILWEIERAEYEQKHPEAVW